MSILFIEDQVTDTKGHRDFCKAKGWETERAGDFWAAATLLADPSRTYGLVVLDIILPWGADTPESIMDRHTNKEAGLLLLQAMRETGDGDRAMGELDLLPLDNRHVETPVIVLSKINDVREACEECGILRYLSKIDYDPRELMSLIEAHVPSA